MSAFVLEDDGAAFAAVITAASLALADAGIHMRDLTAGAAVAVASGTCVLDPCKKEENEAQGGVLVAFMPVSNGVAGFMQTGEVGMTYIDTAVSVCCAAAAQIVALMRTCLYKQEKKALKKRARV